MYKIGYLPVAYGTKSYLKGRDAWFLYRQTPNDFSYWLLILNIVIPILEWKLWCLGSSRYGTVLLCLSPICGETSHPTESNSRTKSRTCRELSTVLSRSLFKMYCFVIFFVKLWLETFSFSYTMLSTPVENNCA